MKKLLSILFISIVPLIIILLLVYLFRKIRLDYIYVNTLVDYCKIAAPLIVAIYQYNDTKNEERIKKRLSLVPNLIVTLKKINKNNNKIVFNLTVCNNDNKHSLKEISINEQLIFDSLMCNESKNALISYDLNKNKKVITLEDTAMQFDKEGYPKDIGITCVDIENHVWFTEFHLSEDDNNKHYYSHNPEMYD